MSKHNNSLGLSTKAKCKCGRYMTLAEDAAGIGRNGYECPDCYHARVSKPLTADEFYAQIKRVFE